VGYGESRPIAPNTNDDGSDNPEGRARNRRTELNVQNWSPGCAVRRSPSVFRWHLEARPRAGLRFWRSL